jgi:hypothetical protein
LNQGIGYKGLTGPICDFKDNKFIRYMFENICEAGELKEAINLHKEFDIDIHHNYDFFFRYACICGNLPIAKWLYSLGGVNIHALDEYAFRRTVIYQD